MRMQELLTCASVRQRPALALGMWTVSPPSPLSHLTDDLGGRLFSHSTNLRILHALGREHAIARYTARAVGCDG